MEKMLDTAGSLVGGLGVAVCLLAGLARMLGILTLAGSEMGTWFVVGIAIIAVGCFIKLQAISARQHW